MNSKYDGSKSRRDKYPEKYVKKTFEVICTKCGKRFEVICTQNQFERGSYRKYCSKQCANSHARTEESKLKTSQTLLRKYELMDEYRVQNMPYKLFKCTCSICGKLFYSRKRKTTHCSPKCIGNDPIVQEKLRNSQLNLISEGKHTG